MRKIKVSIIISLLFASTLPAQIGMGTNLPNALLDLRSSNQAAPSNTDGILIPKVDVFPAVNPTAAQRSMLVYLTTLQGNNSPGFYYWNGSSWVGIASGASGVWMLRGNTGINPAINFLGTTDDQDLIFRRRFKSGYLTENGTAFGYEALGFMLGNNNAAFGYYALVYLNIGNRNVAVGERASALLNNASDNVSFGYQALMGETSGNHNVAFGTLALRFNGNGSRNTAIGTSALYSNNIGNRNLAIGEEALYNNLSGIGNTAIGRESLHSNTHANNNTVIGNQALFINTTGTHNTVVGREALFHNSNANHNTAIGWRALHNNTTGIRNTAVGYRALYSNETTNNNTAIGADALYSSSSVNQIGIGYQATPSAGNNRVRIGNDLISYAYIQEDWETPSDRRLKSNILTSHLGLDFICALHPVAYHRNNDERQRTEYGFIAQELEEVLEQFGADNNGIISKEDNGMYGVRYTDLLAPMVKAIQEQQENIEDVRLSNEGVAKDIQQLKVAFENQKKEGEDLLARLIKLEKQ